MLLLHFEVKVVSEPSILSEIVQEIRNKQLTVLLGPDLFCKNLQKKGTGKSEDPCKSFKFSD